MNFWCQGFEIDKYRVDHLTRKCKHAVPHQAIFDLLVSDGRESKTFEVCPFMSLPIVMLMTSISEWTAASATVVSL